MLVKIVHHMPCKLYQKVNVPGINWFAVDVFNCFYVDSHVLFYVEFLIFMQPTHICYNTHVPVLTVTFRTKKIETKAT